VLQILLKSIRIGHSTCEIMEIRRGIFVDPDDRAEMGILVISKKRTGMTAT
jgi:hypothetical protein